ncbi:MAG: histidine kinase [Sulfurimonas sp.]|nr:MAG: histidine kinase [Sulfurimonas sp.]
MKQQSIKKITLTRLLQVFLVSMLIIIAIIALSYRSFSQLVIENKALSIAEIVKAALTSHMKADIMDKRDYFLNEIATIHDIDSIKIIRADVIDKQFGVSSRFEKPLNDDLRAILASKEVHFQWQKGDTKVEVIVPYIASSKGNLNCLQCHKVSEGDVLGAVEIRMDTDMHRNFAFKYSYIIVAVLLLFALIVILNMFHVIENFICRPLYTIIDEGKKAYVKHECIDDEKYVSKEFKDVAQNINRFNQNVIQKEQELQEKNTELQRLNREIELTLKETLMAMGQIEEVRSCNTKRHTQRVAIISKKVAQAYGLDEEQIRLIEMASPMHDIGKVGIADAILNKPATLDEQEWMIMKTHTTLGYEILKHSQRPVLEAAAVIAYGHHEKYDGTGYPQGLQGEGIPVLARIVAIVDVVDALLSKRVYKEIWSLEAVTILLKQERGRHFDPRLVDVVLEHLDEYEAIIRELSEETS